MVENGRALIDLLRVRACLKNLCGVPSGEICLQKGVISLLLESSDMGLGKLWRRESRLIAAASETGVNLVGGVRAVIAGIDELPRLKCASSTKRIVPERRRKRSVEIR